MKSNPIWLPGAVVDVHAGQKSDGTSFRYRDIAYRSITGVLTVMATWFIAQTSYSGSKTRLLVQTYPNNFKSMSCPTSRCPNIRSLLRGSETLATTFFFNANPKANLNGTELALIF